MSESFTEIAPAPVARAPEGASSRPARRSLLDGAPALSRAQAALSRLLGRGLELPLSDPGLRWQILPGGAATDDTAAQASVPGDWLLLDTAAGPLWLEDGARFLAGLCGIEGDSDGSVDGAWPRWMVGAVAGRLAGTVLASLRSVRVASPELHAQHGQPEQALTVLPWRLQEPGHAMIALAAATPATWLALLAEGQAAALRMPWSDWLPLALELPVLLATHRLPLASYHSLGSGDLILPDTPCFDPSGHGRITLAGRRWLAAYSAPRRLQLLNEENTLDTDLLDEQAPDSAERQEDERYPDEDQAGQARSGLEDGLGEDDGDDRDDGDDGDAGLGAVGVTLRFELGRSRLTLDQLRALGPHSVLELAGATPQAIAICCGGAEVGRGEVVDVDGSLGVRITHWGGAC